MDKKLMINRKENNCSNQIQKLYLPNLKTQNILIKNFLKENENFAKALKQVKDRTRGLNVLHRIENKELKEEFIRGILILYKYGEIGTRQLFKCNNFIQKALAINGICMYKSANLRKK
uniref:Uncharacterized protein n=1 Tax=Meloidogyne hapla TaxID=6305 RepID=A0A1I8BQX7_MELHA